MAKRLKGVILAGGTGSRLFPLTKVTNKHLLPVYDKPMIYYPLETLKSMGCKDIMIVSGREHCGDILNLLGSGREMGLKLSYEIQDEAGGIAHALRLTERFVGTSNVAVCLGDNKVFNYIKNLTPSDRGELEITDVNNFYVKDGLMSCHFLESWWSDAGTFESLLKASTLVANKKLCVCDEPSDIENLVGPAGPNGEFGTIRHSER